MRSKGQLYIGLALLIIGVLILFRNITGIQLWPYLWPTLLVALGVWMLVRPQMVREQRVLFRFLSDIDRVGVWQVADEEIWTFVGDVDLDLTQAVIPPGEIKLRLFGFVFDLEVRVPANVGIALSSTAFVTDARVFGESGEYFLTSLQRRSADYTSQERKVYLEVTGFVVSPTIYQYEENQT